MEEAVLERQGEGIRWMTSAVEASERLIQLVRDNEDIANHAEGCDVGMLTRAERELGVEFPPSYRRVLEEFSTWDIAGTEFLGVYQTPLRGEVLLGSVAETLDARSKVGLPADLIVVKLDDVWGFVVLDVSQRGQDGEYPVRAWNPGLPDRDSMGRVGDNFGSFALNECQMAVTQWRQSS
ncbi:SMI1/KNR4 family protein [Streptomyces sp. NPDC058572]|uniref:SMI1/KNR4 family protein n=1 Tax=Streptomyces sp. NPDC058572 TaxID=3346546 RepID=UPI003657755B